MQEMEITWSRVAAVWWLIAWRAGLGGALIGAVLGFVIGFVGAALGASLQGITITSSLVGALVGLFWSLVVVRMALRKQYGDFRLALVARTPG